MKAELILSCDAEGNLKHHRPKPPAKEKIDFSSLTRLDDRLGLIFGETIIRVHDDLDPWASLAVGFDDECQLIIEMAYERLERSREDRRFGFVKNIIINSRGIEKLIDRLNTSLTGLPLAIADEFAYYEEGEESWDNQEVFDIYNEMLNYLECLGIRYRLEKTYN